MTNSRSWVYTTCPAGWDVCRVPGDTHWYVETCGPDTYVVASDGRVVWTESAADACRLAWERWALEVLGPVMWTAPPLLRYVIARGEQCWVRCEGSCWTVVYGAVVDDNDDIQCTDPVEALARLAALVLAVEGPA